MHPVYHVHHNPNILNNTLASATGLNMVSHTGAYVLEDREPESYLKIYNRLTEKKNSGTMTANDTKNLKAMEGVFKRRRDILEVKIEEGTATEDDLKRLRFLRDFNKCHRSKREGDRHCLCTWECTEGGLGFTYQVNMSRYEGGR